MSTFEDLLLSPCYFKFKIITSSMVAECSMTLVQIQVAMSSIPAQSYKLKDQEFRNINKLLFRNIDHRWRSKERLRAR